MINTEMIYTFKSWERRRHISPEADRILPLLKAAGASGMNRKQLGSAIRLDRDVLDGLLGGLVGLGLIVVAWEDGVPVYRTSGGGG